MNSKWREYSIPEWNRWLAEREALADEGKLTDA